MITQTSFNNVLNYMSGLIVGGRYIINGTNYDVPILSRNISGNTLTINTFLSDGCNGKVTEVKLIDKNNQVFAAKPDSIEKLGTQGVLVIFKFTITEV